MDLESRAFLPHPDVIDTILDSDQAALIHAATKLSYSLNRTGVRIWRLLKEGRTLGEIVEVLCAQFDVEPDRAKADVTQFIQDLVSRDLVRPAAGTSARLRPGPGDP